MMASFVPERPSESVLFSRWALSGLMTYWPSTRPTCTEPVGPAQGISEMERAMELPIIANGSGGMFVSTESAVAMTTTSLNRPFGNSGRMGRSMRRDVRIPLSLALPSRFLKPPGILPTAYIFSSKSTCSGKKSIPSRGLSDMVTLTMTTVSPQRTTHEPFACSAYLPVSTMTFLPPTSVSNCLKFSNILLLLVRSHGRSPTFRLLYPARRSAAAPTFFFAPRPKRGNLQSLRGGLPRCVTF